jgi:hypothetical protein
MEKISIYFTIGTIPIFILSIKLQKLHHSVWKEVWIHKTRLTYCRSQNLPQILFKIIFFKYFSKTKIEKITMVFPHVITTKLTTGTPIKKNSHQEKWRCKRSNHKPLIKKHSNFFNFGFWEIFEEYYFEKYLR